MEEVEESRFSYQSPFTQNPLITSSLGLGLGLGLGFLFLLRSQTLKPLSTAIKLADGAIKGTKALRRIRSPSPLAFVFASKALIKGYKVSKKLNPAKSQSSIPSLASKRLRAYVGAVNLVRCARSLLLSDGFLGLGFLNVGYRFSKNFLKVLEGFAGFQLDSALMGRIEALGVLVKAAIVAREVKSRILNGGWRRSGNWRGSDRAVRFRFGVCLRYRRLDFDSDCGYVRGFSVEEFPLCERVAIGGKPLEARLSELLSLSIPIHENHQPACLIDLYEG